MSEQNLDNDDVAETESETVDEAALEAEATADAGGAGKKTLGLERWVQLGFVVVALLLVWLFGNLISAVWYTFADPNESIVTVASVVAGIVTAIVLYRNEGAYTLAHDVADELSKVTWPTRKETSSSTMIVVVTSLIAAAVLFLFDTIWSAVTDLVYKV